jgi:hypothetical protein
MTENTEPKDQPKEDFTHQDPGDPSDGTNPIPEPENKPQEQEPEKDPVRDRPRNRSFRKPARHYFFEFLMMFLAVFAGFLADNWREQLQEHKREKEFIHSIVEDLKSDTLQSGNILVQLMNTSKSIDTLLNELSSPGVVENSNNAYRLWTQNLDIKAFVSNDRTIQQLKNSGELRLIRNKAVSDGIMKYDQAVKNYYQQSNFMYSALSDQHIYRRFFDFIRLKENKHAAVPLTEEGRKSINEAYAHLHLWNSGLIGLISWLEGVNEEGEDLLNLIQQEYQMD